MDPEVLVRLLARLRVADTLSDVRSSAEYREAEEFFDQDEVDEMIGRLPPDPFDDDDDEIESDDDH